MVLVFMRNQHLDDNIFTGLDKNIVGLSCCFCPNILRILIGIASLELPWYIFMLTLNMPRKTTSEQVFCLSSAVSSCKLFKHTFCI